MKNIAFQQENTSTHPDRHHLANKLASYQQRIWLMGGGFLIALMLVVRFFTPIPIRHLTRDPLVLAEKPFYFGFLSNVGILLWCFTAAICLFSSLVLLMAQKKREPIFFFAVFGLLSLWLMVDDLFMVHEVLDEYLNLVPDKITFMFYGLAIVASLCRFRKTLWRMQPWLLGISLVFFAISIGFDVLVPGDWIAVHDDEYLLEDGFKLLAIFTWSMYFCRAALENLLDMVKASRYGT